MTRVARLTFAAMLGIYACAGERVAGGDAPQLPAAGSSPRAQAQMATPVTRFVAVLAARDMANMAAQVDGTLAAVHVRLGDHVSAGTALASLEDAPLRDARNAARAVAERREIEARAARTRLRHASAEFDRQVGLERSGAVSAQAMAAARQVRDDARSGVLEARAAAREARANLTQAVRALQHAQIRSPVAGIVSMRLCDPGNPVRRGEPVLRIVGQGTPWIRFAVPASERQQLAVGQSVQFVTDGDDRTLSAHISQIAPDIDPLSELVLAEASIVEGAITTLAAGTAGYVVFPRQPGSSPQTLPDE